MCIYVGHFSTSITAREFGVLSRFICIVKSAYLNSESKPLSIILPYELSDLDQSSKGGREGPLVDLLDSTSTQSFSTGYLLHVIIYSTLQISCCK